MIHSNEDLDCFDTPQLITAIQYVTQELYFQKKLGRDKKKIKALQQELNQLNGYVKTFRS